MGFWLTSIAVIYLKSSALTHLNLLAGGFLKLQFFLVAILPAVRFEPSSLGRRRKWYLSLSKITINKFSDWGGGMHRTEVAFKLVLQKQLSLLLASFAKNSILFHICEKKFLVLFCFEPRSMVCVKIKWNMVKKVLSTSIREIQFQPLLLFFASFFLSLLEEKTFNFLFLLFEKVCPMTSKLALALVLLVGTSLPKTHQWFNHYLTKWNATRWIKIELVRVLKVFIRACC